MEGIKKKAHGVDRGLQGGSKAGLVVGRVDGGLTKTAASGAWLPAEPDRASSAACGSRPRNGTYGRLGSERNRFRKVRRPNAYVKARNYHLVRSVFTVDMCVT